MESAAETAFRSVRRFKFWFLAQRRVSAERHVERSRTEMSDPHVPRFPGTHQIAITPAHGVQCGARAKPQGAARGSSTEDVENEKSRSGSVVRRILTLSAGACPAATGDQRPTIANRIVTIHHPQR